MSHVIYLIRFFFIIFILYDSIKTTNPKLKSNKPANQTCLTKFVFYEIELELKNVITFIETGITEFNLLLIYTSLL